MIANAMTPNPPPATPRRRRPMSAKAMRRALTQQREQQPER
jgi:hypothetical protein